MLICKLCLKEVNALVKAHIIPDFLYKAFGLYNKQGKINLLSSRFKKPNGESIIKRPATGIYDDSLLCSDCDNRIIGSLETYANKILFSSEGKSIIKDIHLDGKDYKRLEGIEYKRFKLFWLSVLYRCSITKMPGFKEVSLGPHEEEIRRMIIENDAKQEDDYCIGMYSSENDSMSKDYILSPLKIKFPNNRTAYCFVIGEFLTVIHISKHYIPHFYKLHGLKFNGSINICKLKKGEGRTLFEEYYKRLTRKKIA
jgi:hypothetical protein